MMSYQNVSLHTYTNLISERKAVPGGGSAAAYSAAMGCALLVMVSLYSLGKQSARADRSLKSILKHLYGLQDQCLELVDKDADAYLNLVKAKKTKTKSEYQTALRAAARVPKTLIQHSEKLLKLSDRLVPLANPHLMSDVDVARQLIQAAKTRAGF
jgi:formiminotetrahydrofolate cyclodeaminase